MPAGGISSHVAWAAEDSARGASSVQIQWWRYRQVALQLSPALPPTLPRRRGPGSAVLRAGEEAECDRDPSTTAASPQGPDAGAPASGRLSTSTPSLEALRAVVFYMAEAPEGEPVLSAAVADDDKLTIYRLPAAAGQPAVLAGERSWADLGEGAVGERTALAALAGGYLFGCSKPGSLLIIRDGGSAALDLANRNVAGVCDHHGPAYQRILGGVLGSAKKMLGREQVAAQVRGVLASRRAGGGRGQAPQFDVVVLTDAEVQRWEFSAGENSAEVGASASRRDLGGAARLLGAQLEPSCATSGRWTDTAVQVLLPPPPLPPLVLSEHAVSLTPY